MFEIRTDNAVTKTTTAESEIARGPEIKGLHEWKTVEPAGDPVTVAVMDSGIDQRAVDKIRGPFKSASVTKRHDVTGSGTGDDAIGHGTGVASIIASGVSEVEFYSVRIFGDEGRTGINEIREAYQWLLDHADEIDVVNMSWGATQNVPEINQLHEKLISKDVHDVVAAGNTGSDGGSPATATKAFSAGAVDETGEPVRFSSFDPDQGNPDVAAVGKNVVMARAPGTSMGVPLKNSDYTKASGTSFSAPYVSAAYVNGIYKKRQNWDEGFKRTSEDIPGTERDGAGILKLKLALENADKNVTVDASAWNFKGNDTIWIDADWLPEKATNAEKLGETKDYVDIRIKK